MHVVLLTLMTLSGAGPAPYVQPYSAAPYAAHGGTATACSSCGTAGCNGSACGGLHGGRNRALERYMAGHRWGPMPQTCYNPRFGCYHGNDRHMHRYPAFHGTYYRRPYNYRNLFEYPWHAEMHEPTSYFSYNVPVPASPEGAAPNTLPDAPPLPPEAATQRNTLPVAPRPISQPIFAPQDNRSAQFTPTAGQFAVQVLPQPRLSDVDLAGTEALAELEQQRVKPAPVETASGATPYEAEAQLTKSVVRAEPVATEIPSEQTVQEAPAVRVPAVGEQAVEESPEQKPVAEEVAPAKPYSGRTASAQHVAEPRVAARSISAGPLMLRPLALETPEPAPPVAAKNEATGPATSAPQRAPYVKAKPISLGKPQSLELKPLRAPTDVKQAKAEESPEAKPAVQPTAATAPVNRENALRSGSGASSLLNPLRSLFSK